MKAVFALAVLVAARAGGAAAAGADEGAAAAGVWNHYYAHTPTPEAALSAISAGLTSFSPSAAPVLGPNSAALDAMTAVASPNEDDLGFGDIMQQQQELHHKQMEVRAQREHIRLASRQLEEFTAKLSSAKTVLKENEENLHKWIDGLGSKLKAYQERLRTTAGGAQEGDDDESDSSASGDDTKASFRAVHSQRLAKLKLGIDQLKHERRLAAASRK